MIDQIIVLIYLLGTIILGFYVGKNTKTIKDFAVGPRNFSTILLVATVFASIVGASDTLGLVTEVFISGPIFLISYAGVACSHFLTAYYIAPKLTPYLGLLSSGDLLAKIYGPRAKTLMGLSTLVESILLTGAQILAVSQLMKYFLDIPEAIAAISTAAIIILYSFRGGIKSVTATDLFQFGIMVIAIPMTCGLALKQIGGTEILFSFIKTNGLSMRPLSMGILSEHAAIFMSFALPCLYPLCIQRMLMCKNTQQIKKTFIISGILMTPFHFTLGLMGIIAFIMMPNINHNFALPELINAVLPVGIKGFVIAGLLAIIMSTIDSVLNIGSIAITHDLIGSLRKKPLSDKAQLFLVRISSIIIAAGSIIIALIFESALDVIFLMMVLGNSVFFPGYILGLTNLSTSKQGFWLGVLSGITTALSCIFIFDIHLLHVMLIAIFANILVHMSYVKVKEKGFTLRKVKLNTFKKTKKNNDPWIKSYDYCDVFTVCSIAISILAFFTINYDTSNNFILSFIDITIAILSLSILFRNIWKTSLYKFLPFLWVITLTLSLPIKSSILLFKNEFSLVSIADSLIIIPLLLILTSKRLVGYIYISGIIISYFLMYIFKLEIQYTEYFGYWSLVIHMLVLAICLALFRKMDIEMCQFTISALIHEAKRSLQIFDNSAQYYDKRLPAIISVYKSHAENPKSITDQELQTMLGLPAELSLMSRRTESILQKLFDRVSSYSEDKKTKENCDIEKCVKAAIKDPSISDRLNNITQVIIKDNFQIASDSDQIIQMFLNVFENACHALSNTKDPKLEIIINNPSVFIKDNGIGIAESNLPSIFDEFFSTKNTFGQGLAYCKRVMDQNGGSIRCISEKGSFTEFEFIFPSTKNKVPIC